MTKTTATRANESTILEVDEVSVSFSGTIHAVKKVSFSIGRGEKLALVGESGSGKSMTSLSIMRLLPAGAALSGSIRFNDQELVDASELSMQKLRGSRISMIFQEPMTSLNPLQSVGYQIAEVITEHRKIGKTDLKTRVIELLKLVGIPEPERRSDSYPHELSGGQRQRVMIAMAIANEPDLIIADEPTTALDVTIQGQVLALLSDLCDRVGCSLLLVTHDLNVVRVVAEKVCVMKEGEIVESGPTRKVLVDPAHEYTKRLVASEPKGDPLQSLPDARELLRVTDLNVKFPIRAGVLRRVVDHVQAVRNVSLEVKEGEALGIVGESGSGKTTLGMTVLGLLPGEGSIVFDGKQLNGRSKAQLKALRRDIQVVFQDPFGSLSPRKSVLKIVDEGLRVHRIGKSQAERTRLVAAALADVGIEEAAIHRFPHEFSGGQRQRIAIARALVLNPRFIVLDEPTSALDLSVQSQIIDLLRSLQEKYRLSYLFISHDLKVVRALADRVMVMKDGQMIEAGKTSDVFDNPKHPYTEALIRASLEIIPRELRKESQELKHAMKTGG